MTTTRFLRLASLVALVQGAGHGFLFISATPRHGAEEVAVIEAMQQHAFDFLGSMRSYWDFYFGYGLEAAAICLVEAVLFWQLASLARRDDRVVRPIVALFVLANIAHMVLISQYFFRTPLIFDAALIACLSLAIVAAKGEGTALA